MESINCFCPKRYKFLNCSLLLDSILGPPEKLHARVIVEVDTPSASDALALVDLYTSVGTVRLHAPSDMEVCVLVYHYSLT